MSRATTAKGELRTTNGRNWSLSSPGRKGKRGLRSNNRCFLNGLLWVARSGGSRSDLPGRFGKYAVLKRRYYPFIERGVFDAMFAVVSDDADLEWLMIDSTTIRAHQHAAGARKVEVGLIAQGLCRSRGGLTTKIHTASDALGNPVRLIAGLGQQHDSTRAKGLIDRIKAQAVIADKGYDTSKIEAKIAAQGSEVVIPPKRNRKSPQTYDKERNLTERFFAKLIKFRRIATRSYKHLVNDIGFAKLAAIVISLR